MPKDMHAIEEKPTKIKKCVDRKTSNGVQTNQSITP